jgi:hypothetical protein
VIEHSLEVIKTTDWTIERSMGNPLHYSLELPQRCLQLIEELWPYVLQTKQPQTLS